MYFLILLLSFFAFTYGNSFCESAHAVCPKYSKCVPNVGCVPDDVNCRCPDSACQWPAQCDCSGGCKPRMCNPFVGCGNQTNPKNACETLVCRQGQCVAETLDCENCDPVDGCPNQQYSMSVSDNGVVVDDEEGDQIWDEHHSQTPSHHHHHHGDDGFPAFAIAMIIFIIIICLALFGMTIYLAATSISRKS